VEAPETAVAPERLRPGRGGGRGGGSRRVGRPRRGGHAQGPGQCAGAALLCLPGDLATLEQRVEGGGPEAGLAAQQVGLVWGGHLPVEAEGGADQAVVAAPVVAAVAAEARAGAWRGVCSVARWPARDAGGARAAPRRPGEQDVDQGTQDEAHHDRHAEGYDQRHWGERKTW